MSKPLLNRECRHCTPPCQGGEKLHKRGHCCHSYCLCMEFEPVKGPTLLSALSVTKRRRNLTLDGLPK